MLPLLVSTRFQVHCPPLTGVLTIVRSRYYALSVAKEYLALRGGPRGFAPGFTGPALLGIPSGAHPISCTGLSPSLADLIQAFPLSSAFRDDGPTTPPSMRGRFRLFPFRSPLLGKSRFLSFPPGTEMFQFAAFATHPYGFRIRSFKDLRITGCSAPTRSFSQPPRSSSPLGAKTSAAHP